jgi:hypothetical protein
MEYESDSDSYDEVEDIQFMSLEVILLCQK